MESRDRFYKINLSGPKKLECRIENKTEKATALGKCSIEDKTWILTDFASGSTGSVKVEMVHRIGEPGWVL